MNAAERLVSEARRGRFLEVLPELLDLAARPQGDPDEAWQATAAAVQILAWQDRFVEAADLAEALIARHAPLDGTLCDQDTPFVDTFVDAELHGGPPARQRLADAALLVPEGRILRGVLSHTADHLGSHTVDDLSSRYYDWGAPVRPLDDTVIGGWLVERDFGTLSRRDKRVLWDALHTLSDFRRADEIHRTTGETPEQFALCLWMAGWYALEGRTGQGEGLLLAAHARWWPYMAWDAIPTDIATNPHLRPVRTERVRDHYLTRPIGPEAEKATQR